MSIVSSGVVLMGEVVQGLGRAALPDFLLRPHALPELYAFRRAFLTSVTHDLIVHLKLELPDTPPPLPHPSYKSKPLFATNMELFDVGVVVL